MGVERGKVADGVDDVGGEPIDWEVVGDAAEKLKRSGALKVQFNINNEGKKE